MGSEELGRGTYGQVKNVNGVAVKTFDDVSRLIQEYCALVKLEDCRHVVNHDYVNLEKRQMGMELYDMDLSKWIDRNRGEHRKFLKLFKGFLKGLIYMHCKNLVHADVKPGNILVDSKRLKSVVADCGFVSKVPNQKCKLTASRYRDPVFLGFKSHDMYSCGVILIEYFGKSKRLKVHSKLISLINYRVKSQSFKEELIELVEDSKKEKKNVYKVLTKLSDKYQKSLRKINSKNEILAIEKKIETIHTIVDICKREEYVKIMESAESIPDSKISKIAKNLVQPTHNKRISSLELYKKLYGEKAKRYRKDDRIFSSEIPECKGFKQKLDKAFKEYTLNNFDDEYIRANCEAMRKYPHKFWENFNDNDFTNICISISNLKLSNIEIDTLSMLVASYVYCCIYKRSIVTETLYNIIMSKYYEDKIDRVKEIMHKLVCNKKFVYSLY